MLRASKLYSNGAIRSNLLSNQRISQVVFKVSVISLFTLYMNIC